MFNLAIKVFTVVAASVVLFANVACSKSINHDVISYRLKDRELTVSGKEDSASFINIVEALKTILADSDDRYKVMLTDKTIKSVKNKEYVEVVFADSQEIIIEPVASEAIQVKKILLGLHGDYGWQADGSCNIIFGNPEYDEYNIVVASTPHLTKKDLIDELRKLESAGSSSKK